MEKIYCKEINKKIKDIKINNGIKIIFEDNTIFKITDYHVQDCCERTYADFGQLRPYIPQIMTGEEIKRIQIIPVENMGFILSVQPKEEDPLKRALIPCYNIQDGYYNSKLELRVTCFEEQETIDISNLTR